jgi:hypothetical protein
VGRVGNYGRLARIRRMGLVDWSPQSVNRRKFRFMTLESRYVIDLSDLESLALECTNCHTKVIWNFGDAGGRQLLRECPRCHHVICPEGSDVRSAVMQILAAVQAVQHATTQPGCPLIIRFNLAAPPVISAA